MTVHFFVLERMPTGAEESGRTDVMPNEGARFGEAPRCPSCGIFIGMLKWLPPYLVEIDTWGDQFGDFAYGGGCEWFLVSERFRSIYVQNGLKGLSGFDPVKITRTIHHNKKLRGDPPQYFKVDVVRSQAVIDQSASGFEWSKVEPVCTHCQFPKEGCIKRWKEIIVLPTNWQNEDIFVPRGGSELVANNRFKEICEKTEVRNAVFVPAERYGHDYYPQENHPVSNG